MNIQQKKQPSALRIIAGSWRARKIYFNAHGDLVRPTPDRVRETLFNWLSNYIVGARCLDLYAGSGILGFEALSRKAAAVVAVEQHSAVCAAILAAKESLQAELTLIQAEVEKWLSVAGQPFDIIFLDPPYSSEALPNCLHLLASNNWVKDGSLIYYEHNTAVPVTILPAGWQLCKEQRAGQVHYYLIKVVKA